MRRDVDKIIFLKDREEANAGVFKNYARSAEVSTRIFESLAKHRVEVDGIKMFYPDTNNKTPGVLSDIYGYTGVLSLINKMKLELSDEEKEQLVKNTYYIVDNIKEHGFTLDPYLTKEENRINGGDKLFSRNNSYTGAMTWALSFLVSVRKASKSGYINISPEYQDKIIDLIRKIINDFNSAFIVKDGKPMGWAYTTGCERGSLFFTYSVLEAYSDFEDNIKMTAEQVSDEMSVSSEDNANKVDQELLDRINERNKNDKPIQEIWKENCYAVADHVWDVYKDVLKDYFVDDGFLSGYHKVSHDDIIKSNSSNALFNGIYIAFIFIYGYVNYRKDPDEVLMTLNATLQNAQRAYEQLCKEGMDYLVNTFYIPFKSKHQQRDFEYIKRLNPKMLSDNALLPALVKVNNMVAFYILRYPVKQMGQLFRDVFEKMDEEEWVWEKGKYDVKISERYIEAISDFYVYYKTYEKPYAKEYRKQQEIREQQKEQITAQITPRIRREVKTELTEQFEKEKQQIRDSFKIENAIRSAIREESGKMLLEAMQKLLSSNEGVRQNLEGFDADFAELLPKLLFSFVSKNAIGVEFEKLSKEEAMDKLKKEMGDFIDQWINKIAKGEEGLFSLLGREDN